MSTFISGFFLGLSLILAIGAQNAFVLRQGLRQEHVFAVCLTCALSDAVLIAVGVSSFSWVAAQLPTIAPAMRYGGGLFLALYGARSAISALRGGQSLETGGAHPNGLLLTLGICLALTWLNPHVYLDTVVLLGSISAQYENVVLFGVGAVSASFAFFFSLGYGARLLTPFFARPQAWRVLDALIAVVMWLIALKLIFH